MKKFNWFTAPQMMMMIILHLWCQAQPAGETVSGRHYWQTAMPCALMILLRMMMIHHHLVDHGDPAQDDDDHDNDHVGCDPAQDDQLDGVDGRYERRANITTIAVFA